MNGNLRLWIPGAALASVAIVAGGFFLGVQPALGAAASDHEATAAAETQQAVVGAKLTHLASVAAHQSELDAERASLIRAVPSSLSANTFVRRMNALAALDGVVLGTIKPTDGVAYTPPAAASAPVSTSTGGAASKVYGATDASITAKNFVVIPMTLTATGQREALLEFTHDVQSDERLFLVSTYSLGPDSVSASSWAISLTGSIYAVKR